MNPVPQLPLAPLGLTLGWASREQAREDLALRRVRVVLKNGTEIWSVSGDRRLVDVYAKAAKQAMWTVIRNERGLL